MERLHISGSSSFAADRKQLSRLPDYLVRTGQPPSSRRARLVTPLYGALRTSFSGTTWYLSQAGMSEQLLEGAFTLNSPGRLNLGLQATGAAWKLWRFLQRKKHGGFKFVDHFHNVLWRKHIGRLENTLIISNTQIYSKIFLSKYQSLDIIPCFYIDGTLSEYIYSYGEVEDQTVGRDVVQLAIEMERESYRHAVRIITMSSATARDLVTTYGVPPERVKVVIPGANLDDAHVPACPKQEGWSGTEFTLGFVGLYPARKGLGKLADALHILRSRGLPVRLRVIGRCPDDIAAMDGVEFLGAIDKSTDGARFVKILQTIDLGCQMSYAELLGIAILEFLRVGVPVIATAVGGVPDVFAQGGGYVVSRDISAEELAEELQALMHDRERYTALRKAAIERAGWASWKRAAHEIDTALTGAG